MAMDSGYSSKGVPAMVPFEVTRPETAPQPIVDPFTEKLHRDVQPSNVLIVNDRGTGPKQYESGSGFFAGQYGDILTAAHVLNGVHELTVTAADGKIYNAKISDLDDIKDIASIHLQDLPSEKVVPLAIAQDEQLLQNQNIYGFGHPMGAQSLYVSPGIYLGRESQMQFEQNQRTQNRLPNSQNDVFNSVMDGRPSADAIDIAASLSEDKDIAYAHIEPGNSGGEFVNESKQVVGMASMIGPDDKVLMIPAGALSDFTDPAHPHKFQFSYRTESDANRWLQDITKSPVHTLAKSTDVGIAASLGAVGLYMGHPGKAGIAIGLDAALHLQQNYETFKEQGSTTPRLEYGLKTIGDALVVAGSAAQALPKTQLAGKIMIAAGAALDAGANFLQSHLILDKITRTDGSVRPPLAP